MSTGRLEAFSDGVLAIIITVMVLELKRARGRPPVRPLARHGLGLLTYVLSFVYIGIYWNNHHHMFQIVRVRRRLGAVGQPAPAVLAVAVSLHDRLAGRVGVALTPTVVYGVNLLAAAIAYYVLQLRMMRLPGDRPRLRDVVRQRPQGQGGRR